jgi:hypothetical protein
MLDFIFELGQGFDNTLAFLLGLRVTVLADGTMDIVNCSSLESCQLKSLRFRYERLLTRMVGHRLCALTEAKLFLSDVTYGATRSELNLRDAYSSVLRTDLRIVLHFCFSFFGVDRVGKRVSKDTDVVGHKCQVCDDG